MNGESVDFLVIGGGPGGYAAALHAAHLGRTVTLVDRRGEQGLGGVCLHEGCIPTKALLHIAGRAAEFTALRDAGLRGRDVGVDLEAFQVWKQSLIDKLADGVRRLLASAGVRVVRGVCRFTGPQSVALTTDGHTAEHTFTDAVVATGSRPLSPPGLALDGETVLDSTAALELTSLPPSMVVIGGGSVGMELGAAFGKLGTKLTIVERAEQILPMLDPALVRPLRRRLAQLGVEVVTGATVVDHANGKALVRHPGGEVTVEAACVLAGVGRRPNTDRLGLDTVGVMADAEGALAPAPDRRVTPHIAAVGDLTPGPFHAHKAAAEARVAVEALCGRSVAFDTTALPFIAHADPEVASVGLTVADAEQQGREVRTASFPLGGSGWAVALGAAYGSAQLVLEQGTDVVLGVHLVGPHATELIAEGALAVQSGATVEELGHTIHAHPTLSEQLAEAAHVASGSPVHVARRARR
ncbi:MAG TPA: dihydrolipoyl dehydrogenase [Egibacteraceae bacterium]|nr:dihydrolipoyl dehydrogenase [Egibacteraceae bacterium]